MTSNPTLAYVLGEIERDEFVQRHAEEQADGR
jgi:hypothetical protein